MENAKKLIIILSIILLIILIIIISILFKLKQYNSEPDIEENENIQKTDVELNNKKERVSRREDYFTVKNIVEQYYRALCELNKTSEDILVFEDDGGMDDLEELINKNKENTKKRICGFFDEQYINEKNLTVNNVQEKLGNYKDLCVFVEDMYVKDITITLKLYFVSGTIYETDGTKKEKFELIIAVDSNNSTFNIYTSEYAKTHELEEKLKLNEIGKRTYNKYKSKVLNDEEYAKELLSSYTESIIYNDINYSYSRLNEEYKANKFKEEADYEEYVQKNKKDITVATLDSYKYNICDGYIQYICIDQNNKYYIFNETATMNYNLILDIYTVDLQEFKEKYESASNEQKVILNVQKIKEAIIEKDSQYLYNRLDTTFRSRNFPTVSDLQTFIYNPLFGNEIKYTELTKEGDVFIYKAELGEKTFNIIMKLKDGTDFVYSFSIE